MPRALMKPRIYLDTSIVSAYFDVRTPDRMAVTREFWVQSGKYALAASTLTLEELNDSPGGDLGKKFEHISRGVEIIPISETMNEIAREYLRAGVFAPNVWSDALHVACAVVSRQDILLSWNFKHLVNRRRRAMVNETNVVLGLPALEILAPSEL
ncbi:MAG: PIN domain-containing protein [Candidatus Hydrogenedentes bacterium]|nr:PIN domain-containing protein [Candidatus Hydrogenedentota bacterium]